MDDGLVSVSGTWSQAVSVMETITKKKERKKVEKYNKVQKTTQFPDDGPDNLAKLMLSQMQNCI